MTMGGCNSFVLLLPASLDLSREESMEGNNLLLKSRTRRSRESWGMSVLL